MALLLRDASRHVPRRADVGGRRVLATNVDGVFLCAQQALRHMIPRGAGKILTIGSISAQMSRTNAAPYTTSKVGCLTL